MINMSELKKCKNELEIKAFIENAINIFIKEENEDVFMKEEQYNFEIITRYFRKLGEKYMHISALVEAANTRFKELSLN